MYQYAVTVRGFHIDAYGHVNNARYLEYLEEARWEFLGSRGSSVLHRLKEMGIGIFLVRIEADFRRPAVLDDELLIDSSVAKMGSRSVVFHQKILHRDTQTVVFDAMLTGAVVDLKTQKSIFVTEELREIFEPLCTSV